jgi:hypothetical protein
MDDADLLGGALRQIETATSDERAAIVDSYVYGFAVFGLDRLRNRRQYQR